MAAEKGHTKTGGRKKGSENLVTRNYREKVGSILEEMAPDIVKNIKSLSPEKQVDVFIKLMAYVCPKPVEKQETDDDVNKARQSVESVMEAAGMVIKIKRK